jgi:predicted kinase
MSRPTLVIVSGPAGSGKTTLAHRLASKIGCPALCRDEIKEGMASTTPGFIPGPSDPLTIRTYDLFFAAIRLFLAYGVTHVAEAAFQHANWTRGLEPLLPLATLRIVRCQVTPAIARARAEQRLREPGQSSGDASSRAELRTMTAAISALPSHSIRFGSTHLPSTSTPPRATGRGLMPSLPLPALRNCVSSNCSS